MTIAEAEPREEAAPLESGPKPPTIYLAGDSTMADKPLHPAQPERGWGQMLPGYLAPGVRVVNLAANGRSTKSFRDEGFWGRLMEAVRPGDFVIVQFGHNDEKKYGGGKARVTEPFTSFKQNLARYVNDVREASAKPILATPVARRVFNKEQKLTDTHGDYAVAVRQVCVEMNVPLLEMERRSSRLLMQLGPERSKQLFVWVSPGEWDSVPGGRQDDTHFNATGASRMCDLAVSEIRESVPELLRWLREER